ncbi:hypothetical protein KSP39_PZI000876 [Platanthera zijinensis]|uniref:Uncharacterized protein n=1 Tax=Platanthera zijinensis TaxID=2320716 RepID=A0AAP0C2G5_9ASPA
MGMPKNGTLTTERSNQTGKKLKDVPIPTQRSLNGLFHSIFAVCASAGATTIVMASIFCHSATSRIVIVCTSVRMREPDVPFSAHILEIRDFSRSTFGSWPDGRVKMVSKQIVAQTRQNQCCASSLRQKHENCRRDQRRTKIFPSKELNIPFIYYSMQGEA